MKPHEQEWRIERRHSYRVVNRNGDGICRIHGGASTPEAEALILAAPNMARALLAFLPENGHTMECGNSGVNDVLCSTECRDARIALRKAGVLP